MRSSVACARCRRSKVKCLNNGVGTTCQACASYSRECTYPVPASSNTSAAKRSDLSGGKMDVDVDIKKRPRKLDPDARRASTRPGDDPLSSADLTPKVWQELFHIFKLHYSTELPFLHPHRFREMVNATHAPEQVDKFAMANTRILLLGILVLTARFHPMLSAQYARTHANPKESFTASDHFAGALENEFAPSLNGISTPCIERVQALLMLGLYEWGQTRALRGWVYVSVATRMAQAMGFDFMDDPESREIAPQLVKEAEHLQVRHKARPVGAIEKEIRRRTFWSCAILDRYLSGGRHRRRIIRADEVMTRLPCSESSFLFDEDIEAQAGFLPVEPRYGTINMDPATLDRCLSAGGDGAVLSRFICLVELWGEFSAWSTRGGRRTEDFPPWDSRTTFYKLRKKLENFHTSLPNRLFFRASTLESHIDNHSATMYVSMHTLYFLCIIMLHREYIPFIPLRCVDGPQGPLDAPVFPKEEYPPDPPDFWFDSARQIFKAAADIMDVVHICHKRDALPESAQVAFALYTAAFSGVYAINFPNMDTEGYFQDRPPGMELESTDGSLVGRAGLAVKILKNMRPRMLMAGYYVRTIKKSHEYFEGMKVALKARPDLPSGISPMEVQSLTLRQGAPGGGLEEYKLLEQELKDFGSLADEELPHEGSEKNDHPGSRASSTADTTIKDEAPRLDRSPVTSTFTAVNTAMRPARHESERPQTAMSYGYPSPQAQSHMPPGLHNDGVPNGVAPINNMNHYRWSNGDPPLSDGALNSQRVPQTVFPWRDNNSKLSLEEALKISEGTIWKTDDLGGFSDGIFPKMFQTDPNHNGNATAGDYMSMLYWSADPAF